MSTGAVFTENRHPAAVVLRGRDLYTQAAVEVSVHGRRVDGVRPLSGESTSGESRSMPWICPGLCDIQINGYAGLDLNSESVTPDLVRRLVRAVWATGVALLCPTIVTGSRSRIERAAAAIDAACEDPLIDAAVVGIHLEGPYISPADGPRGAHAPAHVRPPDPAEFDVFQQAARGRIRMVTLSPEWPEAPAFIRHVVEMGVVAAIGHTRADTGQIEAAVRAGARLSTHLGNGADALLPRHPNYIWDQLACDELWASIIADGHHLPASVVKCFHRVKGPGRLILISDAVAVAGLAPGRYAGSDGREVELTPEGRVQLLGHPYLAGAALNLVDGVARIQRFTGVGLQEAVEMASLQPARLLGAAGRLGRLEEGSPATFTLLHAAEDGRLTPAATILDGRVVWQEPAAGRVGDDGERGGASGYVVSRESALERRWARDRVGGLTKTDGPKRTLRGGKAQ